MTAADYFYFDDMPASSPPATSTSYQSPQTDLLEAITKALMDPIASKQAEEQLREQELAQAEQLYEYEAETQRMWGLAQAPLGVLTIAGAGMLAMGLAGSSKGMRFMRWIGGATLVGSGVIAIRRAIYGI